MAVASRASGDDRLWLVTADGAVNGGDRGAVRARIAQAAPLAGAGRPRRRRAARGGDRAGEPAPRPRTRDRHRRPGHRVERAALARRRARLRVSSGRRAARRSRGGDARPPSRRTGRRAVRCTHACAPRDSVTYRIALGTRTLARGIAGPDGEIFVRACAGGARMGRGARGARARRIARRRRALFRRCGSARRRRCASIRRRACSRAPRSTRSRRQGASRPAARSRSRPPMRRRRCPR